ncbi:MAG: polyprenyl diphosphate synthase [Patescibacteria group bacterium]
MKIPKHLAIIMDGNRRWAKEMGKNSVTDGHRAGSEVLEEIVMAARELQIEYLTVYLFSTENFARSAAELQGLFDLSVEFAQKKWQKLRDNQVKVQVYGDLSLFPSAVSRAMNYLMEKTTSNDHKLTLGLCFGYGGRQEIVDACQSMIKEGIKPGEVTAESLEKHLYMPEVSDVDLMIRTGGAMRLSNFLLWKIAYAELYFVDKYWPEFGREDLIVALEQYGERERRFGK